MKNVARLALFFSVFFIAALFLSGALAYLQLWLGAAMTIPVGPPVKLGEFLAALQNTVPLVLYCSVLVGLSYTARRGIPLPAAILCLFILAGGAALGAFQGLRQLKSLDASQSLSQTTPKTLGSPGLILAQRDTVTVVLGNPGEEGSPRVVSIPGRPLIYQETPSGPSTIAAALPPAPFRIEESGLASGFLADSALAAAQLEARLGEGLRPFAIYGGALILLLVSLRFVLDLSSWPLANLFCGALAFRGILALQAFIDSRSAQDFILDFFDRRIDGAIISPAIFAGLALLALLYTLLAGIARGIAREPRVRAPRRKKRREASHD
jgi:hypothetical protein